MAAVHDANPDVGRIAEEILDATLDLVTLQEVDPDEVAGLRRSGVLRHFPYKVTEIRQGASGIALWSRFPLAKTAVEHVHRSPSSPGYSTSPWLLGETQSMESVYTVSLAR